jgi:DNA-binding response OmpR family regulator
MGTAMRILFVEDSDLFLYFKETFVARIGWHILNARDGKSGIARAREERPDLVILSDRLADMPGAEACRQIRSIGPDRPLPMIVILDGISGAKIRQYEQIGCDDYLLRPVDPGTLMERISRVLQVAYRRGPRLLVIMETICSSTEHIIFGNILNLSENGLFVETNEAIEPGTTLDLELRLPDTKDLLMIKGKVARRHKLAGKVLYGIGVQFQELDSRTRQTLQGYIERETVRLLPATALAG